MEEVECVLCVLCAWGLGDVWVVVSVGDEEGGELRECAAQLLYL